MKMMVLFSGVTAAIVLAGCSNEQEHRVAMRKQFSEIDSNFSKAIATVNSSEPTVIAEQAQQFSNSIMRTPLTLTNVLMASNELSAAIDKESASTMYLMKILEIGLELQRSEITNRLLLAKLNFFYTNTMPVTDDAPSNDIGGIVLALEDGLYNRRKNDIITAGLAQERQELAALSNIIQNTPPPPTPDDIAAQKKLEQAEQRKLFNDTSAVASSGVRLVGEVFQILSHGMLVIYAGDKVGLVQDQDPNAFAEGDKLHGLVAYPIGNYSYATKGGEYDTIKKFTVSFDRAMEWHKNPQ
jgi:outer membrane murein-binding lipoprotein Lpp